MATLPTPVINRGEIWLVNFDPAAGAEIQKLRPALVVSLDSIGRLPLRIVVPITDWKPAYANYPWFVHLPANARNGLSKDSGADAFQTKSASTARFARRLGTVAETQTDAIASAIALCVGAV
jgi:mRNA interferase MazF